MFEPSGVYRSGSMYGFVTGNPYTGSFDEDIIDLSREPFYSHTSVGEVLTLDSTLIFSEFTPPLMIIMR